MRLGTGPGFGWKLSIFGFFTGTERRYLSETFQCPNRNADGSQNPDFALIRRRFCSFFTPYAPGRTRSFLCMPSKLSINQETMAANIGDAEPPTTDSEIADTAPVGYGNGSPLEQKAEETEEQQHYLQSIKTNLMIRQLPSQGLSFQLWPAASALVSLIDHNPHHPLISHLSTSHHRSITVLELGSGTGLVGIAAAAILGADVTLTDLPHVLPNLHFNAFANASAVSDTGRGGTLQVRQLRWGVPEDLADLGCQFDLILASDVVYHDHLFDPLLQTLRFFLSEDDNVEFIMAHLRRWKKDSVFFKKARKAFDVGLIHRDPPSHGSRTGVAIYRFVKKGCPKKDDSDPQVASSPYCDMQKGGSS